MNTMNMLEVIQLPFFQRALIVGVLMGVTAALLGVFVVVRRMSFFTDAVAHASLTGVALALLVGINPIFGALAISIFVGLLVARLQQTGKQEVDTIIGVLFSTTLAAGVLLISLMKGYRGNLFQYLFGDIIAVSPVDVWVSLVLLAAVSVVLFFTFRSLTKIAVHEDMARVDGVRVGLLDSIFLVLLAAVVAVGLKVVGAILMSALMILPAATAQYIARSFRGMIIVSVLVAAISMVGGLFIAAAFSLPTGPTIVLAAAALFLLASMRGMLQLK
ncbi:MAG: metal ABC transporter permease [Candidatus Magasanikbacteria bacterium]|nr:metal ABC transporter permease [Candidatus Magasanikbacteria bacterium]